MQHPEYVPDVLQGTRTSKPQYPRPAGAGQAAVCLPRAAGWRGRGAQLHVRLPCRAVPRRPHTDLGLQGVLLVPYPMRQPRPCDCEGLP